MHMMYCGMVISVYIEEGPNMLLKHHLVINDKIITWNISRFFPCLVGCVFGPGALASASKPPILGQGCSTMLQLNFHSSRRGPWWRPDVQCPGEFPSPLVVLFSVIIFDLVLTQCLHIFRVHKFIWQLLGYFSVFCELLEFFFPHFIL
ncbi:hypothetical protein SAY87_001248 [Trapa incisa]|uniref:Uncharacterized protein n=1 Tax=Trapa incisa TaxID=236973 RepID=A0AAN7GV01_9MYRT|nr:hypothetical protein SAY87_001248 [Trapa incisa]